MIRALSKFTKIPDRVNGLKPMILDVTSNSGLYCELSPFLLSASPAVRFENLWQFSKVYSDQVDVECNPLNEWLWWRCEGFNDKTAHRYPKGKGAIPLYSIYPQSYDNRCTKHLGYIEARKKIYAPFYAENVRRTDGYARLELLYATCCKEGRELILLDFDAPRIYMMVTGIQAINNPKAKMGHAFVLVMMLTGTLDDCLKSSPF